MLNDSILLKLDFTNEDAKVPTRNRDQTRLLVKNELIGSIKGGEFPAYLSVYQLL
jgi:hypothetical protein